MTTTITHPEQIQVVNGGVPISLADKLDAIDAAVAAGASSAVGGDLSGTLPNPTVVATHLIAPLPVAQGGTGATSLPASVSLQATTPGTPQTGNANISGTLVATNIVADTHTAAAASGPVTLRGTMPDGATAVSSIIDTPANYTGGTAAEITSFRNNGVEKAYVRSDGIFALSGVVPVTSNSSMSVRGSATDGASAIGVKIANTNSLTTLGAKIVAFYSDSLSTEQASVDRVGNINSKSGVFTTYSTAAIVKGQAADGASAVGVITDTPSYANATAKLLSVRNNAVEKASVDKDGNFSNSLGGTVALQSATPGTQQTGNMNITGTIALAGASSITGTRLSGAANTLTINSAAAPTSSQPILNIQNAGTTVLQVGFNGDAVLRLNGTDGLPTSIATATATTSLHLLGQPGTSGSVPSVVVDTQGTPTGGLLLDVRNTTVSKFGIGFNGKINVPTGGAADVAGNAVLVAGTVTVSTTAVTASSVILLTRKVGGGTAGIPQVGTITAGTSFVINSVQPGTASTLQNADTSTISWMIIN